MKGSYIPLGVGKDTISFALSSVDVTIATPSMVAKAWLTTWLFLTMTVPLGPAEYSAVLHEPAWKFEGYSSMLRQMPRY